MSQRLLDSQACSVIMSFLKKRVEALRTPAVRLCHVVLPFVYFEKSVLARYSTEYWNSYR